MIKSDIHKYICQGIKLVIKSERYLFVNKDDDWIITNNDEKKKLYTIFLVKIPKINK